MKIQIKIQITDLGGVTHECNIAEFDKGFECAAEIGLSIEDSKGLLLNLQQELLQPKLKPFVKRIQLVHAAVGDYAERVVKVSNIALFLGIFPSIARAFIIVHVSRIRLRHSAR